MKTTTIKADLDGTETAIVVRFDTHHSGYHDDAGRFTVKADLVTRGFWLDADPVPEGFCAKVAEAVRRLINRDANRDFYALDVVRVDFSHGEAVEIGELMHRLSTAAAEGKTHIVPFETKLGIPYSNETVAIVRMDHGQAVAEVINAGEELSPSGTACELFEEALVAAAMGPLSLPDSDYPADLDKTPF
jgi:hypothetical protein